MRNTVHALTDGWLVVARQVLTDERIHQLLFVAAIPDPEDAVEAVSALLGSSQRIVKTACHVTPRALMRMRIKLGEVKRISCC